jgi:hypothetical protein
MAKAQAHKAELARAEARRVELAEVAAHKAELAKAARQEQVRFAAVAARAHRQEQLRLAAAAKVQKQEQLRLAAAARAEKKEQLRLAKAEAKGRAEALAEAREEARHEAVAEARADARKRMRLASLVHAIQHALPRQPAVHARGPVELARTDRRHAHRQSREPQVEQASLSPHRARHLAGAPARGRVAAPAPPARASGLMKVSAPRCANRDPGEALVCADPSLGAADRQLARAYQGARAAGVSDAQLQRQQQHWLAARSAAAREAPWAVHDVYLARIAELNGMAREAHGDGY